MSALHQDVSDELDMLFIPMTHWERKTVGSSYYCLLSVYYWKPVTLLSVNLCSGLWEKKVVISYCRPK